MNGCKPHLINRFYEIELGLKSIFSNLLLFLSFCFNWSYQILYMLHDVCDLLLAFCDLFAKTKKMICLFFLFVCVSDSVSHFLCILNKVSTGHDEHYVHPPV